MPRPKPSKEDLALAEDLVRRNLASIRDRVAVLIGELKTAEEDAVLFLYKLGMPTEQIPPIVQVSRTRFYELLDASGQPRRNVYPRAAPEQQPRMNGGAPTTPPG